jgi:branched-chain amino acid aminotransferase
MKVEVHRTQKPKARPNEAELGFGKYFSDHMALADYSTEKGWHDPRVVPYAPLSLDPGAGVFHYGQALFEGLKAFRAGGTGGRGETVNLFRLDDHCARMAKGAPRLCMPAIDSKMMRECVLELVRTDIDWVPKPAGTSMYLRPFMIASEAYLGVRAATRYQFCIIASPVGAYYAGGVKPVRIWVEQAQTRAAPGGLGAVKAGANYAASLWAAQRAKEKGYDQVLWLDGVKHEVIEEVGTMNLFVVLGDELITPPLSDSILAGITRDTVVTIARQQGVKVTERPISMHEINQAQKKGMLKEVFGSGTAAVISPVGELAFAGEKMVINGGQVGTLAGKLYEEISGVQRGNRPDPHHWLTPV